MKANTMNSSNGNYFSKMISTNKCILIKVHRKCSVKENMYILPPQNIKFLVQCPRNTLLMYIYSLKTTIQSLISCVLFLEWLQMGQSIRFWWICLVLLRRVHLFWVTKSQGQQHQGGKSEKVRGKKVKKLSPHGPIKRSVLSWSQ